MEETAFNPKRRLCPDGSCVGVLSGDGRCSVCDRPAGAAGESLSAPGGDQASSDDGPASEMAEMTEMAEMADATTSGFDPTRRLCDDGTCVGVVGPDGVCGTCGRKAD